MTTRWACLIGQPVAQSLSPTLHNAAFRRVGMDARYELRETALAELPEAIAALRVAACFGANVTAPHKQAVLPLLDSLSDAARALGAVNTIVNRQGWLFGENTDAGGLARWMRSASIDPRGQPALVLGAGGAARAAVWALAELGAGEVVLLNRTESNASAVIEVLRPRLHVPIRCDGLEVAARQPQEPAGIVINATSLGHHGLGPQVHPGWYSPGSVAVELVYNPPVTPFMRAAQAAGARVENGLGMLVHQAALAFECWTGQPAPLDAYEDAAVLRQAQHERERV